MATQEELCEACNRVSKNYKKRSAEPNAFTVHVNVEIFGSTSIKKKKGGNQGINAATRKQGKKNRLDKLAKVASALRNKDGGSILVHLCGHAKGDRYLGYFDEFIGDSFTYLIEDGKLYVDIYRRFWLDNLSGFSEEKDFVCVNVSKTKGLSTVDFNTKIRNDFENVKATPLNVLSNLVSLSPARVPLAPVIRHISPEVLQESRHIEFKSISKCEIDASCVPEFIDFIWVDLKLRENVTSMTKIPDGGSFYIGVAEITDKSKQYGSKTADLEGFELVTSPDQYITCIERKLKSDISVLNSDGKFADAPEDLIAVRFHPVPGTSPTKHILEVSIRQYDGIVFYEKGGPRAYTIDNNNNVCRMTKEEWLKRVPFEYLICPLLFV